MSINAKKTVNVKAATAMLNDHKRYDSLQTDPERVEYLNELLYLQFDKADFDMVEAILDSDVIREGTDYCTAEAWDNDTNILAYRKMLDVMYNAYIKIAFNRAKGAFNVLFDLSDSNHVIVVDFIDYTTSFLIDSELCGTLEEGEISEAAIELDMDAGYISVIRTTDNPNGFIFRECDIYNIIKLGGIIVPDTVSLERLLHEVNIPHGFYRHISPRGGA